MSWDCFVKLLFPHWRMNLGAYLWWRFWTIWWSFETRMLESLQTDFLLFRIFSLYEHEQHSEVGQACHISHVWTVCLPPTGENNPVLHKKYTEYTSSKGLWSLNTSLKSTSINITRLLKKYRQPLLGTIMKLWNTATIESLIEKL